MKDLIGTGEAAYILGVSSKTLITWRERKIFGVPFFAADEMHGGTWYYERERVEQLKSVYHKGVLQNIYKLAQLHLAPEEVLPESDRPSNLQKQTASSESNESISSPCGGFYSSFNEFLNVVEQSKENVQIYPIKKRLVPNFKLCKVIYGLDQENYNCMVVTGKHQRIVEKKNHKMFGTLFTVYRISNADGFYNDDPLNEFDYAVFSVCVSYFGAGCKCITLAILYRALTGKGNTYKLTPDLRNAILNSLKKLIGTIIEIDETDVNAAFKYADTDHSKHISAILPAHFDNKIINGNDAFVVYFDCESPLMEIARNRKQLLTYEVALLDAHGIRNTFMNIMLKSYVMRRVVEIKYHKKLRPILTFADIFKKCRIDNAHREIKMNARNTIVKFFEHLQAEGFFKSFELTKEGNAFYSIRFIY